MEHTNTILKNTLGLTETEVQIYTAGLNFASVGVSDLEKVTRIKRPTIYHAINTLMSKGLASKRSNTKKMVFTMTRPEKVQNLIEKKIDTLKKQQEDLMTAIPFLVGAVQPNSGVQIAQFEGVEGVKMAFEEAIYCKSREWCEIAAPWNFIQAHKEEYLPYFLKMRKQRGIVARTLWEGLERREFLSAEDLKTRGARFLPKYMHGKFKSMLFLFDDKILLIGAPEELSAVLIQSKHLHSMMQAFFDGLWAESKPIEKITLPTSNK